MGFLRLMHAQFPQLQVVGAREGRDDAETNYRLARTLLKQHPDLVGLYNLGGGAEGVGHALQERRGSERTVFVAHGLTPDTRALLIDGTLVAVINQHPQTMVLNTVRVFTNLRDGRSATVGVEPVRISIMLRENPP
jgi:LacI family transcriptional regulator